jgi:hypothetical protein
MALALDRYEDLTLIEYFMNETAEAGAVVVFDVGNPSGTGAALDDVNSKVKLSAVTNGSGENPAGILIGDVVNKDLTQTHLNQHKRETQVGGKVGILRRGIITTNFLAANLVPKAGDAAYFTSGGRVHLTATNSTRIGTFLSGKNANGEAKLYVNLP